MTFTKRKTLILVCMILVLVLVIVGIFSFTSPKSVFSNSDPLVYIPFGIASRHKVNSYFKEYDEYWIYKICSNQAEKLKENISEEYWEDLGLSHIERFPQEYDDVFTDKTNLNQNCYICIYDVAKNEFITSKDEKILEITTHWVIIIYDETNKYYYFIHQSL